MQTHKKHIFLFSSLALLLSSCADYKASMLDPLSMDTAVIHSENQNQNVLVAWKFFDAQDCQTYLGRDVISEGYIPLKSRLGTILAIPCISRQATLASLFLRQIM